MAAPDLDPWGNYYFSLELDETEVAHFREVSGIKTSATMYEIEEGGFNGHVHKRVAQSRWENIVLKQASSVSTALVEWRDKFIQDKWDSRPNTTGAIVMRDNSGSELRRFTFVGAWPVSWEGPQFASGASDIAVETLEIAHEGLYIGGKPKPQPEPEVVEEPKNFAPDTIEFENDSAELTPEGEETVAEISKSIEESEKKEFWIEGHTNDLGPGGKGSDQSHAYNQKLSQERAEAVAARLKAQHPDATFHVTAHSFDHPKASNSTPGGQAANRRTDVFDGPPPGGRNWLQ